METYLNSKQKYHFESENNYICIQANAFWKQGAENAKIWLSLQNYVETKEDDCFQMAQLSPITLAGGIRSHWKS